MTPPCAAARMRALAAASMRHAGCRADAGHAKRGAHGANGAMASNGSNGANAAHEAHAGCREHPQRSACPEHLRCPPPAAWAGEDSYAPHASCLVMIPRHLGKRTTSALAPPVALALEEPPGRGTSSLNVRHEDKVVFDALQAWWSVEQGRALSQWDAFSVLLALALENPGVRLPGEVRRLAS